MVNAAFQGIWPVLVMPFLENGAVDEISLCKEIDFLLQQRVDGIVVFGLASEIYKFSDQERNQVIKIVVSQVNGAVPIVAGTEHSGSEVAAERSYQAQELGVSGVMVYPPTFVKPDTANIMAYYRMIDERIHIPIMIQDAQTWTQVPLPVDLLIELAETLPQVQYVKIETPPTGAKISKVIEAAEGKLQVFAGYGGLHYFEEMDRGAVGTLIPPAIAPWFVDVHHHFHAGRKEEAKRLFERFLPFMLFEMASLDTMMEIQKTIFHRAGLFATTKMRKPHTPMDAYQKKALSRYMDELPFAILNGKNK